MINDKRLAHNRRWFEYHCYEGEDSSDAELWHHTHQQVIILRKLNCPEEIDPSIGKHYIAKFADGLEYEVCDDELTVSPKDFFRPDYKPKKIKGGN